ncbi:hypothetical protein CS369_00725 [Candidatus Symbiopectobacterium sp. 'North America']|uniref:hypothetical protein n=1 Tax=Candidatus Symbiopectobacterium sp. 'North America' TaxID=2794574 RepID=UPI0018C8FBCA|nr:hypothetical protein [Candidatus Symbiopectobacterium sp. 'North America']MBG6243751.1 hypothetical protein [Candidatus Symbiopectobacterium sp. 'North America']
MKKGCSLPISALKVKHCGGKVDGNEVKIIKKLKIYKKIALRLLAKIDVKQLIAAGAVFHSLH